MILKLIRNIVYSLNDCNKKKSLTMLIRCADKNLKINPYSYKYKMVNIKSIENNIVEYTNAINNLIDNINNNLNEISKIKDLFIQDKRLGLWMSDNDDNILVNTDGYLKRFFKASLKLNEIYILYSSDLSNSEAYWISMKIKPYIINIEGIIRSLIESYEKEYKSVRK